MGGGDMNNGGATDETTGTKNTCAAALPVLVLLLVVAFGGRDGSILRCLSVYDVIYLSTYIYLSIYIYRCIFVSIEQRYLVLRIHHVPCAMCVKPWTDAFAVPNIHESTNDDATQDQEWRIFRGPFVSFQYIYREREIDTCMLTYIF